MPVGLRKFVMTTIAFGVILGGLFACAISPAIAAAYTVFVGGVLTALGLYVGGNVGTTFLTAKKAAAKPPEEK